MLGDLEKMPILAILIIVVLVVVIQYTAPVIAGLKEFYSVIKRIIFKTTTNIIHDDCTVCGPGSPRFQQDAHRSKYYFEEHNGRYGSGVMDLRLDWDEFSSDDDYPRSNNDIDVPVYEVTQNEDHTDYNAGVSSNNFSTTIVNNRSTSSTANLSGAE